MYNEEYPAEPIEEARTRRGPENQEYTAVPIQEEGNRRGPENQNFWRRMEKGPLIIVGVIVGVIALLLVILLPISFSGVEYYQYAFKRRTTTGEVFREKVYSSGRHAIGPDCEFKVFPADAQFMEFNQVTVFALDRLQVTISVSFQYFLRKHQLSLLHQAFDKHYEPVIKSNSLDALKGAATLYETREYIRERQKVEKGLFKAVRERVGGKCCEKDCDLDDSCFSGCLEYEKCEDKDFGLFAEVRYFQLAELGMPSSLAEKFLKQLTESEKNEKEKFSQEALLVRKETEAQVKDIENSASEIRQNATSQSERIRAFAGANATALVEKARIDGLRYLYTELNITQADHKSSFDYLRTLKGQDNINLAVDYQTLMTGPL